MPFESRETTLPPRENTARTLQLDRRLVRLAPDDAIAWYNLSCTYAVLGMIDPAFSALERSLELGYRLLSRLKQDPDLKTLRRDPRFLACSGDSNSWFDAASVQDCAPA